MNSQGRLINRYTRQLPPGTLQWIGLRGARKGAMQVVAQAMAISGYGLEGDHRCQGNPGSGRQITLISGEYIAMIAHFLAAAGAERFQQQELGQQQELVLDELLLSSAFALDPALLRRNLVVNGMNLTALRHQRFRIGEAEFEASALCHPCSRMEQALGPGGVAAMLGHGGLCARIIRSGTIRVGDPVLKLSVDGD